MRVETTDDKRETSPLLDSIEPNFSFEGAIITKNCKMPAWRQVGLNYVNYSQIAARMLRQALKADLRAEAAKRDDSNVKFTQWKDGKPIKNA